MTVADDLVWAIIAFIFLYFCWRVLSETKRASRHAQQAEENTKALVTLLTAMADLDQSDSAQDQSPTNKHLGSSPRRSGNPENIEILSKGYEEPKRYATGFFDREFNPKFLLYLAGGVISLWLLLALLENLTHQL
mgnify:CR=1 FL=1|tara:strand:- start:749 stop:1153 length:405 start_codon:yes stop_codon:yes gene_type:complete